MDDDISEESINKTILKKLEKRSRILKNAVILDKPKIYKMNRRNKKFIEVSSSIQDDTASRRDNANYRGANYRALINQYPQYQYIKGLYVLKPFYKIFYLNNFYDALELTYYSHRNDPTFININNGKLAILFNGLNLYQLIEYSHQLNPTLSMYLFRYLVDMLYLLNVPQELITDFYLRSRLIIVRYEQGGNIQPYINDIRASSAIIVTMSLGPDVNVYDFVPQSLPSGGANDVMRVFYQNGAIVVLDGEAKYLWTQTIPTNVVYTDGYRYEIILLAHKYTKAINCYNDVYGNRICYYFDYAGVM